MIYRGFYFLINSKNDDKSKNYSSLKKINHDSNENIKKYI